MQVGDRRTDERGIVWEVNKVMRNGVYSEIEVSAPQDVLDERAAQAAAVEAEEQAAAQKEAERVASLKAWDNQYITLARALGLPDKATTQEVEAKLTEMKQVALGDEDLQGYVEAVELGVKFLAIMNAITQSGGKHEGIKWHDDI